MTEPLALSAQSHMWITAGTAAAGAAALAASSAVFSNPITPVNAAAFGALTGALNSVPVVWTLRRAATAISQKETGWMPSPSTIAKTVAQGFGLTLASYTMLQKSGMEMSAKSAVLLNLGAVPLVGAVALPITFLGTAVVIYKMTTTSSPNK